MTDTPEGVHSEHSPITCPDGKAIAAAHSADTLPEQLTATEAFAAIDWDARARAAIEATLEKRRARLEERNEKTRRRDYGLIQRHARKTAHFKGENQ